MRGDSGMDKDRVKGGAKEAAGKVQKNVGKLTGNENQQARGQAREVEGKVQKGVGKIKDAGKAAANKLH
jgi:uncharacterized protein YjbJ (UPF0337 family)